MKRRKDVVTRYKIERNLELPVKCIKCETEIKRIDYEENEPKKGEYVNDIIDFDSPGCIGKGIAPGILVELINPSLVSLSSEEEETFHGYMCDGCLQELCDKKIIEDGPDKDKKAFIRCIFEFKPPQEENYV